MYPYINICFVLHPPLLLPSTVTLVNFMLYLYEALYLLNFIYSLHSLCWVWSPSLMDPISIKTPNPKCWLFLKIYLAAGVYLPEAPGVVKQFCRFGIWSNTHYKSPVYALHTTRSPPPPVAHCINTYPCTYSHREVWEGRGVRTTEKVRGALVHKRGRKYQHDWLYLQSINSIKHQ